MIESGEHDTAAGGGTLSAGGGPLPARRPAEVRLVVADPLELARWALSRLAQGRPGLTVVGEAASSAEATALAFAVRPDVITIDDAFGAEDTWQLAAHLRAAFPRLGIVILSGASSAQALLQAMDVGASAFVARSAPVSDVVAAIRAAAAAPSVFAACGPGVAARRGMPTDPTTTARRVYSTTRSA